ncbi:MAG TPA: DEAD/DEAH box helicase [Chloroflexia bacterium]|nr:DEAD/DEAH box helicase [Chloroflexia bacterium]
MEKARAIPYVRPAAPQLLEELKKSYNGRGATTLLNGQEESLVHVEKLEARDPVFGELSRPLPEPLRAALFKRGITQLYSHQAESVEALRAGQHVALVTATASGKTLSFNLPVLETILREPQATALYLFPTNALMNDQLATLSGLLSDLGEAGQHIKAFKYNGAMSDEEKKQVRRSQPNILLTNPELVHLSLTAWHRAWPQFLRNLRYIVIDEVHTYRGVFGSHIAHLLRRLRRVCAHYGANPQFICCSATIGNPLELVQKLTGLKDFTAITNDGARKNERYFVVWKPPTFPSENPNAEPVTRSYLEETVDLFKKLQEHKYSTLCFSRLRRYAETMYRMVRESTSSQAIEKITVYRAGLRADERVAIERGLKEGQLEGVFSTNALELGIDIGGLDAVIIAGYPGSQMAVWQQAGRAGRGDKDAAVFLVASQNPVDQYFLANPEDLFNRRAESALLNVENENIARQHLACMAQELPFNRAELEKYYSSSLTELVLKMIAEGTLASRGRGICYYPHNESPHNKLSLRTSTTHKYTIVNHNSGREIGLIEPPNLYSETHPGAIYTHAGETFRVENIDEQNHKVLVRPITTNYVTSSVGRTEIKLEKNLDTRQISLPGGLKLDIGMGTGEVVEEIFGYREEPLYQRSRRPPDVINLEHPLMVQMRTELLWLVLPPREHFSRIAAFDSGLHGLEHLLLGLFPLEVMCDPTDIGSTSDGAHIFYESRPTIYFFDSCEGGAGFAHGCYDRIEELLKRAYSTIKSCRCTSGCPACVQSARCREASDSVSKTGARLILQHLLFGQVDLQ